AQARRDVGSIGGWYDLYLDAGNAGGKIEQCARSGEVHVDGLAISAGDTESEYSADPEAACPAAVRRQAHHLPDTQAQIIRQSTADQHAVGWQVAAAIDNRRLDVSDVGQLARHDP